MLVCTVEELNERRSRGDEFLLIDVRTPEELEIAAIEGAYPIPLDEISTRTAEIEDWKNKDVVCMCHHGMRSAHAQKILMNAGFSNVHNLSGGIHAWSVYIDPSVPQY